MYNFCRVCREATIVKNNFYCQECYDKKLDSGWDDKRPVISSDVVFKTPKVRRYRGKRSVCYG